jgi:PAS domain S-box-containing protein
MFKKTTHTNLFVAFCVTVFTAMLFLFLFFNIGIKNRKYTYEDSKSLAKEISRKVASETEVYLSSALNSAQSIGEMAKIYRRLGGTRNDIIQLLLKALHENPNFMGAWTMWEPNAFDNRDRLFKNDTLYDQNGTMSIAFFKYKNSVQFERNEPGDYDENFYTLPLQSKKDLILDPFHYQYHGHSYVFYQTSAVFPIIIDSTFMGVFGIDINLDSLQNKLNKIRLYNTGYLSLITGSGVIVSHADSTMINRNFFSIVNSSDSMRYAPLKGGQEMTTETTSEFSGEKVFRFFYPIHVGKGTKPWFIMVEIPIEKATTRSRQLLYTAYATLVIGLLLFSYLIVNIFDRRRYEKEILHSMHKVEESNRIVSESERNYREIFNSTHEAIFIHDADTGKILDINDVMLNMYGFHRKEEVISCSIADFTLDNKFSAESEALKYFKLAITEGPQVFVWHAKRKNGEGFWVEVSMRRSEIGGVCRILAVVRDITARKMAEEALQASEKNFRNIFERSRQGIIIVDHDLKILGANGYFYEISGFSQDETSLYVTDIALPDQHSRIRERLAMLMKGTDQVPQEYKVRFRDDSIHYIEATSSMMDYYGRSAFLVILRDNTYIREAEHKLMEAIIKSEENERSRIAQDLHDGLGPVLSTIKLYFQVYQDTTEESKKLILIEKLRSTIEEAIKGVSEISHNISPHVLKNYGFYAAIKQFIHRIALTNVVKFNLDCGKEWTLSENTGIILYRTISELINNSIRHSGCNNISVTFRKKGSIMQVDYSDDGRGFDVSAVTAENGHGSGVQNIRNRINALQGEVSINSIIGEGMEAMFKVPV